MGRTFSSTRAVLGLLTLVVFLTACNGKGPSSTPASSSPASSSPASSTSSSSGSSSSSSSSSGSSGSSGSGSSGSGTSTGSVTLNWTAPTQNTDGTSVAANELAGYKIVYGESANAMYQSVAISSATATSYTIQDLPSGTWYFAIVSVDSAGNESLPTNVISTTI